MELNYKKLMLNKNPNNISIDIIPPSGQEDTILYPIRTSPYDASPLFTTKIVNFFCEHHKDSVIIIKDEQKSVDLLIKILEKIDTVGGVIIRRDKRFYITILSEQDTTASLVNDNVVKTHNMLYYFREMLLTY